eukprot:351987-Chlamydomonas_euryale.AAC.1
MAAGAAERAPVPASHVHSNPPVLLQLILARADVKLLVSDVTAAKTSYGDYVRPVGKCGNKCVESIRTVGRIWQGRAVRGAMCTMGGLMQFGTEGVRERWPRFQHHDVSRLPPHINTSFLNPGVQVSCDIGDASSMQKVLRGVGSVVVAGRVGALPRVLQKSGVAH